MEPCCVEFCLAIGRRRNTFAAVICCRSIAISFDDEKSRSQEDDEYTSVEKASVDDSVGLDAVADEGSCREDALNWEREVDCQDASWL